MKLCKPIVVGALVACLVTLSGCWCGPGWWGDGEGHRRGDDLLHPAARSQTAPYPKRHFDGAGPNVGHP